MLLPILGLAFFALQLDCGNISTVLTSTITSDLTITPNQINLLAWGFVATFQALMPNYASFLATRLLLSLLEGGYILGALFYLSTWYKKKELSSRVTLFFFGQKFSAATSNLISAGLLKIDHSRSTWNLIGYICLREMPTTASGQHKDGTPVAASVGYAAMHIVNVAWLAVNCTMPQERSVALALIIMAANLSGFSGGQIFRTGDAPLYRHGLTALSTLAGAAWVQAVGC
ncbi:uncharacterized protein BO72DRAFT_495296 [Aspergillus fijiensis CBS 313.89]|uniref:MFS general substrate transporter n=1 Tax=Aspergillus fijiensis CBS 313.89 TaxID=1448319 RepID=A0A8G1RQ13_9EURO|nr:uncharacterized protein BO72DRAFT_495296 [Aspergillus fijiensis CBS 313.89]RAK78142.1 hypothetical protein BO72DRAFT_495296 [Aspergillus fijiensis CBS 313.89]